MDRQRTRDRLTGAAVALAVVVLSVLLLLWEVSEPAGQSGGPSPQPPPTSPAGRFGPPSDLADDETWLGDVVLDAGQIVAPDTRLRDVEAVAQDVRTGPDGTRAGTLRVSATLPFEVVSRNLGRGNLVRRSGSRAQVLRTVVVAGRRLQVAATGDVTVVAGRLVVEPRSIDVGGPDVLSRRLADVVRGLVTIEQDVEGLPEGLVLRRVTVVDGGFRAQLSGQDVRLVF